MIDFNDPTGREFLTLIERLKYERFIASELDDILTRAFNQIVDVIVSGKYRTLTAFQQQRLAQLFRTLATRIAETYDEAASFHLDEMKAYAALEAELTRETVRRLYEAAGLFSVSLGAVLSKNYLTSLVKLPVQGLTIGEWFDAQARTMTLEVRRIIQQGLIDGIGPYAIASKIVAPANAEGPMLLRRAKNEARMVSRTTVNAVQNDAHFQSISTFPTGISDGYVYEAVLDSHTTPICRALSGRVFRYDDPRKKLPPQHIGCRSTIRALLKGVEEPMADQRTPRTLRNYDAFLRTQSVAAQNDILGPARASLWRSGSMTLADAIDADNRVLTLKQLRARLGLATVGAQ
jgi:SPP1 gp7 family putative phage head morphogenesis protein